MGFPDSSVGKEPARSAGDLGLIPELRRSPGEGNDHPLQYSYLESLMDRGAWWALWCRKESDMTEWLILSLSSKKGPSLLCSSDVLWYCPELYVSMPVTLTVASNEKHLPTLEFSVCLCIHVRVLAGKSQQ